MNRPWPVKFTSDDSARCHHSFRCWRGHRLISASPRVAPEPASRRGETGGVGKPARFCQEKTHVLAEQFGTTEHDGFRGPYLSGNTPEAAFHGQAGRPCSRTCCTARPLISERTREAPLPWAPDDRSPQRTRRTGRRARSWNSTSDSCSTPAVRPGPQGRCLGLVGRACSASSSTTRPAESLAVYFRTNVVGTLCAGELSRDMAMLCRKVLER